MQRIGGSVDREISSIQFDSRRVGKGCLFIALRGDKSDGHQFIEQAIAAGAVAVLCANDHTSPHATTVQVADTRAVMAAVAANFHRHPSRSLKIAGVTGTNGKTTTAFLIKHLCATASQWRCGLIGTVRYEIADRVLPALHTTPESADIQELLAQMVSAGCKAVAMEVSSHAIDQERHAQTEFDVAVFTNLTQDHLDYHGTMNAYFDVKTRLFSGLADQAHKKRTTAVINADDSYGARLVNRVPAGVDVHTYGVGSRANFRAGSFTMDFHGMTFQLHAQGKSYLVRLPLIGRFNMYNALAALAAGAALGLDMRHSVKALASAPQVPGRLEAVPGKRNFRVFIDYAHTPDALINVIKTLRELNPARLIVVFGCGGDRDKGKRPLMGAAVEAGADHAIVTSDNPRTEEPGQIIKDVIAGFRGRAYEVIEDRREAIFHAVAMAGARDIVLIAGKGHEDYQEINGMRMQFSDLDTATWAVEGRSPEVFP